MPDNLTILLIGASQMAADYYKVLAELGCSITVVGRSKEGVAKFKELSGADAVEGGLEQFLKNTDASAFTHAIVAVGLEELKNTSTLLLDHGIKNLLVEKPAGLNFEDIAELNKKAMDQQANVFVAYNRRFYESLLQAKKIIADDGGISSFHFEFTEWSHVIEGISKKPGIKENWFLANSSHVVDMAFFVGGEPAQLSAFVKGSLSWHPVSVFAGSGISDKGALFTYHSNWEAPGRWAIEFLTTKHRLILKPLEELHIQKKGSIAVEKMEIDTTLDKQFKPGIYKQVEAFLSGNTMDLFSMQQHTARINTLKTMLTGNN